MRVLHVTGGNLYGGVESFLATLARESAAVPEMSSEFAVCFEWYTANQNICHVFLIFVVCQYCGTRQPVSKKKLIQHS